MKSDYNVGYEDGENSVIFDLTFMCSEDFGMPDDEPSVWKWLRKELTELRELRRQMSELKELSEDIDLACP